MSKKNITQISIIILVIGFVFLANGLTLAWTPPTQSPPNGNVPSPINVGSSDQYKTGGMGVSASGVDSNYGLTVVTNNTYGVKSDRYSWFGGGLEAGGWQLTNNYLRDDGEDVIMASDEWLRLNNSRHFSSGVYTPGKLRVDGGIQIGNLPTTYAHLTVNGNGTFEQTLHARNGITNDSSNSNGWLILADYVSVNPKLAVGPGAKEMIGNWQATVNNPINDLDPWSGGTTANFAGNNWGISGGGWGSGAIGVLGVGPSNTGNVIGVKGLINVGGYSNTYAVYGQNGNQMGYDFYAAGAAINNYGAASSIRWKNNIEPIDNALAKVLNMRGVYFDWDEEHGGRHDMGMIAEEVGQEVPEVVVFEDDGVYATGMDYSKLTPILLEAIKEQHRIIESLEERIEILETKLDIE